MEPVNLNELCKLIRNNIFKILVVGDVGVGKTSIIFKSTRRQFSRLLHSTVGLELEEKNVLFQDRILKMQLWDVSGQEMCSMMSRMYYRNALGAFIVYDLTNPESFESVMKWKKDMDRRIILPNGEKIPCIILANKCETIPIGNNSERFMVSERFVQENGFVAALQVSAKSNIGLDEAFQKMADVLVNQMDLYPYICPSSFMKQELIKLDSEGIHFPDEDENEKNCCLNCLP